MPTPSIRSTGTYTASANPVLVPYPATIVAGDVLFFAFSQRSPSSGIPTPSGWTLLVSTQHDNLRHALFTIRATGSESGTVSITTTGTGGPRQGQMWCIRDVPTALTTWWEDLQTVESDGSDIDAPTITPTGAYRLGLLFLARSDSQNVDGPGTFTGSDWVLHDQNSTLLNEDGELELYTGDGTDGGTIVGGDGNISGTVSTQDSIQHALAVIGSGVGNLTSFSQAVLVG